MIARWRLTNSEAGWITAAFYGAYMLAVPVLVTLTDRIDAKRVYLGGVAAMILGHAVFAALADGFWSALAARSLTGIGWAGTYMTGLKLLADKVDAKMLSRAAAGHAASIGISGALSYICADLLASVGGWRFAFVAASASAVVAWLVIAAAVPTGAHKAAAATGAPALFDFRPVLRNRSAMAYAIAYGLHTLEMAALRGWGVAFLAFVAAGTGASAGILSPTSTLTALGLLGTLASLAGNEGAIHFGRRTLIAAAMVGSVALAGALAMFGAQSYPLAGALLLIYGAMIWLDSARSRRHRRTADPRGRADPRGEFSLAISGASLPPPVRWYSMAWRNPLRFGAASDDPHQLSAWVFNYARRPRERDYQVRWEIKGQIGAIPGVLFAQENFSNGNPFFRQHF